MLRCNTLIINNAQQIESGNIPVNIGDESNVKIENGDIKIKDDEGNWNALSGNKHVLLRIENISQTIIHNEHEYIIEFGYNNNIENAEFIEYDNNENALKFNTDGVYVMHYYITVDNLNTKNNNTLGTHIEQKKVLDTNYSDLYDSFSYGTAHKKPYGLLTLSSTCILNASQGDYIRMILQKFNGSGMFRTVPEGISITIVKIN